MLEVHLGHLRTVTYINVEYITSLTVFRHILVFTFLEGFQFSRIITFIQPACFYR